MPLDHIPLKNITRQDIDRLIEFEEVEDRKIDYKQDYRGGGQDVELCFDITAFANGMGGDLLYGVPEKKEEGVSSAKPLSARGMKGITLEQVRQKIEPLLSSRVQPRLSAVEFAEVKGDEGPIVIVRVPKSWRGPHLVRVGDGNENFRCYIRTGGGKGDPLDAQQLRDAFLLSSSIPEKIRAFHRDRIGSVLKRDTPVQVTGDALLLTHVFSLSAYNGSPQLKWDKSVLDALPTPPTLGRPGSQSRHSSRFNLDGYVYNVPQVTTNSSNQRELMNPHYVQLYRSGIVEVVQSIEPTGEELPHMLGQRTATYIQKLLQAVEGLDFSFPAYVAMSLLQVEGMSLYVNGSPRAPIIGQSHPFDRNTLNLPELLIEDAGGEIMEKLRPALDALWQAGGYSGYFE